MEYPGIGGELMLKRILKVIELVHQLNLTGDRDRDRDTDTRQAAHSNQNLVVRGFDHRGVVPSVIRGRVCV